MTELLQWPGLPVGVSSGIVTAHGLNIHILESEPPNIGKAPLLLLLHGFPELSYSWRKLLVPLAQAGYHVVAPDQRGFGRTHHHDKPAEVSRFEDDLYPYRLLNITTDIIALVQALGYTSVAAVIGHDFGSRVAGSCALIRPDMFKSVIMMSSPFTGAPSFPPTSQPKSKSIAQTVNQMLATLDPPKKHYTMYFSTADANKDMHKPPQGLHDFLRTYFHMKSADWEGNRPYRLPVNPVQLLTGRVPIEAASHIAAMPPYYIMPLNATMPEVVTPYAPSASAVANNKWLPDKELAVYATEYGRTGFQGGLNWYRCMTDPQWTEDMLVFANQRITVPAAFIAGKQDWGTYQVPGAAEAMKEQTCKRMDDEDFVLIESAGHWVQQEQPEATVKEILRFLKKVEVQARTP